jgi:hypothetical protein
MWQPPKNAPPGTVWFGGSVDKSTLSLRLFGGDLDPEEVSVLLGCAPTVGQRKGARYFAKSGRAHVAKHGSWRLEAPESEGADLDGQLRWIFSRLTKDLKVWKLLSLRYRMDVFSGLFLKEMNRGISLSSESLKEMADRNVSLGFDIYYSAGTP